MQKNDESQKLIVDFHKVQYGMMDFTMTIGEKSFETNFSEAFDPIIPFKKWLEAICIGVYQCSFWFDPEGTETKFSFERRFWNADNFTVSYNYDDKEIFLEGKVERRQLVEAFYCGLLDFRDSPRFDVDEWEKIYLYEEVTKNLSISYHDLIEQYAALNRTNLIDALFEIYPKYRLKEYAIKKQIRLSSAKDGDFDRVEWDVPINYDSLDKEAKREFVKKCFQYTTGDMNGTKIADFKSKIIEDFLNQAETK